MKKIYQRSFKLSRLHDLVESGIFAVPQLQREFVWNAAKACQLLDSVYRNYPIGTLLVWKTGTRNEGQLRKQFHILPSYDRTNGEVYFLIDGQQRLSVLWRFLRGEATIVENSDGKEIDFGRVYFDLEAHDEQPRFVCRSRSTGDQSHRLVPLIDILSPRWLRRLKGYRPRARARIAECRDRIRNYEAFVVFCESSQLEEVRETFVRINSLGMKISSADRAFARASAFDLRNDVRDALHRLKHGFDALGRQTILQTIAFALGVTDVGDRAIDAMVNRLEANEDGDRETFSRIWPHLRESFALATDYLVQLGVPHIDYLPSEPMIIVLALYFFYNRNKRPPPAAQRTLNRWFWATAVGSRYTGRGYRPNLTRDAAFMYRLAKKPRAHARLDVSVPRYVLWHTEYGRPGPVSNAFFILLRRLKPRYLADGTPILLENISSRKNRSDKHHIYPRSLLLRAGVGPERFHSILNICLLVARENQSISDRQPNLYLQGVSRKAIQSHLIPNDNESGVWRQNVKKGFKEFLTQRSILLVKAFEHAADMRLFERA